MLPAGGQYPVPRTTPLRFAAASCLFLGLFLSLCSCIFVPRTTQRYDPACGITERHMTLDAYQVGAFGGCRNEGCAELLVLAGAVSAASFVVSGSVVVVGEVVYWLEARGRCLSR